MTLQQLEYAIAVWQEKHFGKAAERCFVTQPTLSMQLQKLEETIGFQLFNRQSNPIIPTREGESFLAHAHEVLLSAKRLETLSQTLKSGLSGEFRIGVMPTLGPYYLPDLLPVLVERFPKIHFVVQELTTGVCLQKLGRFQLDAAILATPLEDSNLLEEALFYEPFYLYASPKHPLLAKTEIVKEDLDMPGLVLLGEGHCFRTQVLELCRNRLIDNAELGITIEAASLNTLISFVDNGEGFTLLPQLATRMLNEEQQARLRPVEGGTVTRQVSLVSLKGVVGHPLHRQIFRFLSEFPLTASIRDRADAKVFKPLRG